jgi:hypothetical protein
VCELQIFSPFQQQHSVYLDRKRTTPTEPTLRVECVAWLAQRIFTALNLDFLTGVAIFRTGISSIILLRLSGPLPDTLLVRKYGRAGNTIWTFWISSQGLWPLDHRCGPTTNMALIWTVVWACIEKDLWSHRAKTKCSQNILVCIWIT